MATLHTTRTHKYLLFKKCNNLATFWAVAFVKASVRDLLSAFNTHLQRRKGVCGTKYLSSESVSFCAYHTCHSKMCYLSVLTVTSLTSLISFSISKGPTCQSGLHNTPVNMHLYSNSELLAGEFIIPCARNSLKTNHPMLTD